MSPAIRKATRDDIDTVDGIMRHPDVLPGVLEGTDLTMADVPDLGAWFDTAIFLLAEDDEGEPGAVVIFESFGDHALGMHLCLLKQMRGPVGDEVIRAAVRWVFTHTKTQRIHASFVTAKRRLADKLERCGFFHSWPTTNHYYMETLWDQWVMADHDNMVRGSAIYAGMGVEPRPWDSGLVAAVGFLALSAEREGAISTDGFNQLARVRHWPQAHVRINAINDDGSISSSIHIGNVAIEAALEPGVALGV